MTNYWDKMHDSQMLAGTIKAQQDELKVFKIECVGGFSLAQLVPNLTITCIKTLNILRWRQIFRAGKCLGTRERQASEKMVEVLHLRQRY